YGSLDGAWTDLLDVDLSASDDAPATTDFEFKIIDGKYVVYPANNKAPTAITGTCIVYYTQAADANTKSTATVVDCI
nr:hypothetical protein [Pseudoalteromonas sp.]